MAVYVTGFGHWRQGPEPWKLPLAAQPEEALPEVRRKDVLAAPDMAFGRMDDYCRLGLLACSRALAMAGLHSLDGQAVRAMPRPCGIAAATLWGCLPTDAAFELSCREQEGGSPHLFAYTLPSIMLGEAALRFDLRGPAMTLQASPEDTIFQSLTPLTAALDCILAGDALAMLAGCCEADLPDGLALPQPARGAFFVLLEMSPPPAYAHLRARLQPDKNGGLLCGGNPINDMQTLLAQAFA